MTTPRSPQGGNRLGIARGTIDINTQRLQQQRRVVISAARDMGRGIKRSFDGSTQTVNTFNQSLDSTVARINQVQGELTGLALGGAALTGFGLQAADNLNNLRIRFRELAGDQERGLALMEEIGQAAADLNLPVRQTQADFAGLVPAIRQAGGEIDEYFNLVARLATLNTQEGTTGAVFAIREALASGGTDLVSLAERFNLPRSQLRQLIEETGDFATALDIALNQQGATNEALESFSGNLQTARTRLQDAATRGLERAFNGQLENAIFLVNGLADAIDAIPDGVLEIGGSATIALTGVSALALGLAQARTAYTALAASGALRAGAAGAIAVGGLAAAPGISTQLVRSIGRITGNERLASQTQEDTDTTLRQTAFLIEEGLRRAGRTLQQILFLIANATLEAGRDFARTIALQVAALQNVPSQIDRFSAQFDIASGRLLVSLGELIQGVGNLIPGVNFDDQASGVIERGNARITSGEDRIEAANEDINNRLLASQIAVEQLFDEFAIQNAEFFGVIESESSRAQRDIRQGFDNTNQEVVNTVSSFVEQAKGVAQRIGEGLGDIRDNLIADGVRERLAEIRDNVSFQRGLNSLQRDGTVEQVNERISALEDERAAIEQMLPQLEAIADTSDEAAQELDNYRSRLDQIDSQVAQLANITPELAARQLDDLSREFADTVAELEKERGDALANLSASLTEDLASLDKNLRDSLSGAREEEIEAIEDFQEEQADITEQHQQRLLEIERRGREDIIDAAGRLDAAGVFAARRAREQQAEEAKKRFDEQNERNRERLEDTVENLSEERQEILENYQERRGDLIAAFNQERQLIQQRYQNQLRVEQQAFRQEANLLRQAQQQKLAQQQAFQQAELQTRSAGNRQVLADVNRFVNGLRSAASRLSSGGRRMARDTSTRTTTTRTNPFSGGGRLQAFNTGGVARFSGSGEALAFIQDKERVLTPQQTASFDRLVDAIAGSAGAPAGRGIDSIQVDVSGAESFEDMVAIAVRQTMAQVFRSQIAGA